MTCKLNITNGDSGGIVEDNPVINITQHLLFKVSEINLNLVPL